MYYIEGVVVGIVVVVTMAVMYMLGKYNAR